MSTGRLIPAWRISEQLNESFEFSLTTNIFVLQTGLIWSENAIIFEELLKTTSSHSDLI
jgi:hypothetical protein